MKFYNSRIQSMKKNSTNFVHRILIELNEIEFADVTLLYQGYKMLILNSQNKKN